MRTATNIYTTPANLRSDKVVQVVPVGEFLSNPSWSKTGAKLAFLKKTGLNRSIMTCNFDGSNLAGPLATFTSGDPELAWSPDGSRISFSKIVNGALQIFTINSDGTGTTNQITTGGIVNDGADWSPDGLKLVFSRADSATGNRKQLFIVDSTGTNQNLTRLTNDMTFGDHEPTWSPDGTKIAFLRSAAGVSSIVVMNADGTNQAVVATASVYGDLEWSPDGTRLAFTRKAAPDGPTDLCSILPDGTHEVIIQSSLPAEDFDWGRTNIVLTPPGSPITVGGGLITLTFPGINVLAAPKGSDASTTITPVSPASFGIAPNGYNLAGFAYHISTTANYTPPVDVCFNLEPGIYTTQAQFNKLRVLHNETGVLVDRTVLPNDFANRKICASVDSLGAFVLAELEDPTLPSIRGLIIDQSGNPLTDILVSLSGDEKRFTSTDVNGLFVFTNLTQNGNYIVQPSRTGYVFNLPYQSYFGMNGEETVVFTGEAKSFSISGRATDENGVPVSGVEINLEGSIQRFATTDGSGEYSFIGLPANGLFTITPAKTGLTFNPPHVSISALQNTLTGVNFISGGVCAFGLTSSGKFFAANGGSGSVNIATGNACAWTAAPSETWITIVSADSGSGNGVVDFEVRENFTQSARQAIINIADQLITIVQDGGLGDDCNYSISPFQESYPASGGSGSISVNAEERCAWQAISSAPWVTFTANEVGIGSATLSYTVLANPGPGGRSATITIGGKVFAVKQKAP